MAVAVGDTAPDLELANHRGERIRLSQYWTDGALLLVFLRHLGCPLCFDHVAQIRARYNDLLARGLQPVLVTMGDAAQAAKFRETRHLECDVLADPGRRGYVAYGLDRGGLNRIAGPQMWWAGLRSILKFGAGRPIGDVRQMPGAFVIAQNGKVLYAHRAAHSGDLESYDQIAQVVDASKDKPPAAEQVGS